MTTFNYTSTMSHASDAGFRAWVGEYLGMLSAIGLVQTGDTGQLDVATLTGYNASGASAYQIFRFDDSLQAVAPIFLKFEFGNGSGIGRPSVYVTVGTGTDGVGNITGLKTVRYSPQSYTISAAATTTYGCHTEGFAGVIHRVGGSGIAGVTLGGSWAVCRTCDANGHPTADGVVVYFGSEIPLGQCLRFKSPQRIVNASANTSIVHLPLEVAVSIDGEIPFFPLWMPLPELVPVFGLLAFPRTLVPAVDTVEVAMVGSTPRNYLLAPSGLNSTTPIYALGILWE